ncbi:MAG TPA: hypothetical protein ENH82_20235 [bacterium]|nr:hypothetical protein [bacterium]
MPDSALPENLWGKKHTDWPFFLRWVPRGWTAFKWRMPPKLLIGYNVKIWETGEAGDENTLEYPFGKGWVNWRKCRIAIVNSKLYGPSTVQKLPGQWKFSFHVTWPFAVHFAIKLWKKKKPNKDDIEKGVEQGYDQTRIIYCRFPARWDSYDHYWQCPGFFFGFTYN